MQRTHQRVRLVSQVNFLSSLLTALLSGWLATEMF